MTSKLNPTIYKLKNNRLQVSYCNPATKKRVRKKFKILSEAEKFKQDIETLFIFNSDTSSADSVEIWMKRYLNLNPRAFIKRLGQPMYDSFLQSFGSMPVMSVSRDDLLIWLNELQQKRRYSVKTMPNIASAANQFFQFIVDSRALAVNPMHKVKFTAGKPPKDRVILSEEEIEDLLSKLKQASPELIYPVIFLLVHTGARTGEIFNLKWNDVNFEMGTIQLLRTKNGEDRLLHPSKAVMKFLSEFPRIGENVVLSQYHLSWTSGQYRKQLDKFRRKINFHKYWWNHSLRHSFATNYLKQGGDMLQLQKILGHKSLQMTVDLYGRIEAFDVLDVSPFKF